MNVNLDDSFRDVLADILDYLKDGNTDTCALEFTINNYKLIINMTVRIEENQK